MRSNLQKQYHQSLFMLALICLIRKYHCSNLLLKLQSLSFYYTTLFEFPDYGKNFVDVILINIFYCSIIIFQTLYFSCLSFYLHRRNYSERLLLVVQTLLLMMFLLKSVDSLASGFVVPSAFFFTYHMIHCIFLRYRNIFIEIVKFNWDPFQKFDQVFSLNQKFFRQILLTFY